MKGGQRPVLRQKWYPSDFQNDPWVRTLLRRGSFTLIVFYRQFLDWSFMEGGRLSRDPGVLGPCLGLGPAVTEACLQKAIAAGKLATDGVHVWHERVASEITEEIDYRVRQGQHGLRGGRPAKEKGTLSETENPPSPSAVAISRSHQPKPSATPTPTPTDNEQRNPAPSGAAAPREQLELAPTRSGNGRTWSAEACDDWIERFGGTAPGGQIGKHVKPLVDKHGWEYVRHAWKGYLVATEGQFANPARFAQTFGEWSRPITVGSGSSAQGLSGPPIDVRAKTVGQVNLPAAERLIARMRAKGES